MQILILCVFVANFASSPVQPKGSSTCFVSAHNRREKERKHIDKKKNPFNTEEKNNNEFISFSSMHIIKLAKRREGTDQANQIFTVRDFFFFLCPDIFIP